jgi:hypothetical protein
MWKHFLYLYVKIIGRIFCICLIRKIRNDLENGNWIDGTKANVGAFSLFVRQNNWQHFLYLFNPKNPKRS